MGPCPFRNNAHLLQREVLLRGVRSLRAHGLLTGVHISTLLGRDSAVELASTASLAHGELRQ